MHTLFGISLILYMLKLSAGQGLANFLSKIKTDMVGQNMLGGGGEGTTSYGSCPEPS